MQAGAKGVTIVDLSADAINRAIDALAQELGAEVKDRLYACAGDVSQEETAERYVQETIRQFHRLDISVQCAGISLPSTDVADLKVSDWDKTMGVNLRGGPSRPSSLRERCTSGRRNVDACVRRSSRSAQSSSECSRASEASLRPLAGTARAATLRSFSSALNSDSTVCRLPFFRAHLINPFDPNDLAQATPGLPRTRHQSLPCAD